MAVFLWAASAPTIQLTAPGADAHAQLIRPPNEMERVWPGWARRNGKPEHVVLDCVIADDGRLKPCAVVEEAPTGHGFAAAALSAIAPARMRAPSANAHVEITIDYLGDVDRIRWMWIYE
jgi:hypothetical protein